jgi:prepilin-type N-terminal cleavage/methylation domain-containing protein
MHKSGFTLLELTIALSLTAVVVALISGGLMAVLQFDQRFTAMQKNRRELQRTMDFIAIEMQMSDRLEPCPEIHPPVYSPASGSQRPQPIMVLTMPASSNLSQPIVYYVAAPPARSVWAGPLALYRWGPTLQLNGNYSANIGGAGYSYYNEVVVDRIVPTSSAEPCGGAYPQAIPLRSTRPGFNICSDPSGRVAKISLQRQAEQSQQVMALQAIVSSRSRSMTAAAVTCPAS